ncbi:MAG: FAD-binding oxidoreductase [Anaeromyxobacteraceae bacterium]|nr:FAD-binding oxidoreductase [Anaeromyxobacteraceae bacterium]
MRPIEETCYWLARLPRRAPRPLEAPAEHDVVVLGAGLTGLWTALFLKALDPARDVAVVEQGMAAWGASGRNAGMLAETIDHTHGLAIQHFGAAEAARLAALGEENVRELTGFLRERAIECDYQPSGRFMASFTPAHLEEARRNVEIAEGLGIHTHRLLSREEMQAEVHSPRYVGGLEVRGGGILDPARFTDGLRREAERAGVRVYERTRVERLVEQGAGVRLDANGTTLRARRAVLGTSAYTHHLLPQVRHRFIPLYDYIMVSEPLTAAQWDAIGWKGRQGITDGRTFFNYYRPTADGRILWGTSEAAYYRGNRVDEGCDHSQRHYDALRESWRRTFPQLAGLEWPYAWGGPICSTTRMTPYFGQALGGKAWYGLGFTGHGLGSTRVAGRVLAHLVLEQRHELLDLALVRRKPLPYPPEPLRGWAVDAVTRDLRKVDEGEAPSAMLRLLEKLGIGFSS